MLLSANNLRWGEASRAEARGESRDASIWSRIHQPRHVAAGYPRPRRRQFTVCSSWLSASCGLNCRPQPAPLIQLNYCHLTISMPAIRPGSSPWGQPAPSVDRSSACPIRRHTIGVAGSTFSASSARAASRSGSPDTATQSPSMAREQSRPAGKTVICSAGTIWRPPAVNVGFPPTAVAFPSNQSYATLRPFGGVSVSSVSGVGSSPHWVAR
jgi:hypothetical protein